MIKLNLIKNVSKSVTLITIYNEHSYIHSTLKLT